MMVQSFEYNGNVYYSGTVIKTQKTKFCQNMIGFSEYLVFEGIDINHNCRFRPLHNIKTYTIPKEDLNKYIALIEKPITIDNINFAPVVETKHIDGIIPAYTWYILIMFGSIFLSGILSKILVMGISSAVFWSWKSKKKRGE